MFNKLSFDEMSKLYAVATSLEKKYGRERVQEALQYMSDDLDGVAEEDPRQLTLPFDWLPDEDGQEPFYEQQPMPKRKAQGYNENMIEEYFKRQQESNPDTANSKELILKLYYVEGLPQRQIGEMIGVKQRAISQFIHKISEREKREIIQKLKNEGRNE